MTTKLKQSLILSMAVVWTGAMITAIAILNRQIITLSILVDQIDTTTNLLEKSSREIHFLVNDTTERNQTLQTLQQLLEYLPKTEANLRSQKALMDDVQTLRVKISRALKGKTHILVDTKANVLYLKKGMKLLLQADCSVGRGGIFTDKATGRRWEFVTPRGKFRVLGKNEQPVWIKPDWAYFEEGQTPPAPNDPSRRVPGELGNYLLNLGNGYLIHGTKREDLLGRPASHGCVRLGADDLKSLYEATPVGTEVYIY